jgi:hypothetical protein
MRIRTDPPVEIRNVYVIDPFEGNRELSRWTSQNPALGVLLGRFVLVGDSILSVYRSEAGEWAGMEYLKQDGEPLYRNRGALMRGDAKVSSWVVRLER